MKITFMLNFFFLTLLLRSTWIVYMCMCHLEVYLNLHPFHLILLQILEGDGAKNNLGEIP